MKIVRIIFPLAVITVITGSCNMDRTSTHAYRDQSNSLTKTDSAVMAPAATANAVTANENEEKPLGLNDPGRKVIKTADLKCRVEDVYQATTRIERIVTLTGGQIADSHMENSTEEVRNLPYKSDSLKQARSYTTTARLSLRVPVIMLDTVLRDVAGSASFIDSRNLHLDDVTLRLLSNRLKNEAMGANDVGKRALALAGKSREAVYSGEYADERNNTRIDRHIENLQLSDQVNYATLSIELYQPQRLSEMIVPDMDNLMKPTLGQQIRLALYNGWQLLRAVFVGLLQVWPLLILAIGGFFLFRTWKARRSPLRS